MYVWSNSCDFLKAYHFNGATFDTGIVSESTSLPLATIGRRAYTFREQHTAAPASSGLPCLSPITGTTDVHLRSFFEPSTPTISRRNYELALDAARRQRQLAKVQPANCRNGACNMASFPQMALAALP